MYLSLLPFSFTRGKKKHLQLEYSFSLVRAIKPFYDQMIVGYRSLYPTFQLKRYTELTHGNDSLIIFGEHYITLNNTLSHITVFYGYE